MNSDSNYRVAARIEFERRVGAAGNIVERHWIRLVIDATDLVDGLN